MNQEAMAKMIGCVGVGLGILIGLIGLVGLGIAIAVCWFLMTCFEKVPEAHRKQNPGLVWLLLIPCFNFVWSFFVFPKLADSYKSYFDSVGKTDVGDCGRSLAMVFCILPCAAFVLRWIPIVHFVNCVLGPAALVIFIIFLVKAASLNKMIQDAPAAPAPPAL